jgi:hypothetical protein
MHIGSSTSGVVLHQRLCLSNFEQTQSLPCLIMELISNHSKAFLIPVSWCHNPAKITESWTVLWIGTALSEFLLQGPISAFVGAFGVGTKYEDVSFAENLGSGTC